MIITGENPLTYEALERAIGTVVEYKTIILIFSIHNQYEVEKIMIRILIGLQNMWPMNDYWDWYDVFIVIIITIKFNITGIVEIQWVYFEICAFSLDPSTKGIFY